MSVFDPETKKMQRVWTGQSSRFLLKLCSHANKERIAYVGRGELMEKTDLNGQSIETFERRYSLVAILTRIGKTSYRGSAPVNCYLIDLPGLPPLEEVLAEEEVKQRARKVRSSKKASKQMSRLPTGSLTRNGVFTYAAMGSLGAQVTELELAR
ncbi:MAG: hypothetical protein ACKOQU_11470 [Acidimicrobiaceae bacterium]